MDELIQAYYDFQTAFANLVAFLPLGYAFGAGMVASVNPCGFLALPSFGLYYLGLETGSRVAWQWRLWRALVAGLSATAGFIILFSLIGLVIVLAGRALGAWFPVLGVGIGVLALGLGVWVFASNRTFGLTRLDRFGLPVGTGARPAFVFGVAYGVLSLACTLPVFLVVVTTSAMGTMAGAVIQFVAYALGMGVVILAVALSAALAGGAFARWLAAIRPLLPRITGVLLLFAGAFVLYYWLIYGRVLV